MKQALKNTQIWLETMVIGLNLCPFARPALQSKQLQIELSSANDADQAYNDALKSIQCVAEDWQQQRQSTRLLVMPEAFVDFDEFWQWIEVIEDAVEACGLAEQLQIAHFHPDYCFADEDPKAHSHYSNRAPYPSLHILQRDQVNAAIEAHPDALSIPQTNIDRLNAMSAESLRQLVAQFNQS